MANKTFVGLGNYRSQITMMPVGHYWILAITLTCISAFNQQTLLISTEVRTELLLGGDLLLSQSFYYSGLAGVFM